MSTLDEITKEKQRIGEALARVDAQREKLTAQRTGGDRACACALRQRHAGKKDGLSQDTEQRNDGGRSSAITRAAHHDR